MPKGTRKCKICGREYEYCRSMIKDTGMFRWQDVACCKEHGAQYFQLVLEARGELPKNDTAESVSAAENAPKKKTRRKKTESAEPTDSEEMA